MAPEPPASMRATGSGAGGAHTRSVRPSASGCGHALGPGVPTPRLCVTPLAGLQSRRRCDPGPEPRGAKRTQAGPSVRTAGRRAARRSGQLTSPRGARGPGLTRPRWWPCCSAGLAPGGRRRPSPGPGAAVQLGRRQCRTEPGGGGPPPCRAPLGGR